VRNVDFRAGQILIDKRGNKGLNLAALHLAAIMQKVWPSRFVLLVRLFSSSWSILVDIFFGSW
jgi:hypothetical protein